MTSINLISSLTEGSTLEEAYNFNRVVAWFLRKTLEKKGVEVTFVRDRDLPLKPIPKADHTLVISALAMYYVAGNHKNLAKYVAGHKHGKTPIVRNKIRKATKGKIAVYLDADYPQWFKHFDYIFTVVKPYSTNPKCVYAGWGADPEYCYPEQKEKAVFLDKFNLTNPQGREKIYKIYEKV